MVKVISGGLYTTIQDLGRYGYRKYGVPLGGAMDSYSSRLANRLVGNNRTEAVMEITYIGPVLRFDIATEIAITGAGFSPTLNNIEIPLNTRIQIPEGSILKFGLPGYGQRAYLSVAGGFKTEYILGSYSYHRGITLKPSIDTGDQLSITTNTGRQSKVTASVKIHRSYFTSSVIEVFKGPEFNLLSELFQQQLLNSVGVILPESNRMAYLLSGYEMLSAKEIITAPVQPGTVQLMPSGRCAVLMRDAQTTGGYARVLQLTEKAINQLAQKRAGEEVQFKLL